MRMPESFIDDVQRMRKLQNEYSLTKNPNILKQMREVETKVDFLLKTYSDKKKQFG